MELAWSHFSQHHRDGVDIVVSWRERFHFSILLGIWLQHSLQLDRKASESFPRKLIMLRHFCGPAVDSQNICYKEESLTRAWSSSCNTQQNTSTFENACLHCPLSVNILKVLPQRKLAQNSSQRAIRLTKYSSRTHTRVTTASTSNNQNGQYH